MAKFTDLPIIYANGGGNDITDDHVFAVSTTTTTDQISLSELQKSFTGIMAREDAISILGYGADGVTISGNGFLGVNKTNPNYSIDIGDQGGAGQEPEIRMTTSSAARKAAVTLSDSNINWTLSKEGSDTDFYVKVSENDSDYTGVINIDKNGNVGIFDGSAALSDKLYVYGGTATFENDYSVTIDPGAAVEIRSDSPNGLFINASVSFDTYLGNEVLCVSNANRTVGINTLIPTCPFDVNGTGNLIAATSTSDFSSISLKNTSTTSYLQLTGTKMFFGNTIGSNRNNLCYDVSNKFLGVGTNAPSYKLQVYDTTSSTIARFSNSGLLVSEVLQSSDDISGKNILYTFARETTKKWGVGLYNNAAAGYSDAFIFRVDSDTSRDDVIVASLTRTGNLDIKGSYTSNGQNYANGKFVHTYQTRCTGDCIYFSPFAPDSSTNPSGHNDFNAPFGIAPYPGNIEKIQIFSSDQELALLAIENMRFEFCAINPVNDPNSDGYVSGFFVSPPTQPTLWPVSGIVGQLDLNELSNPNTVYTYNSGLFYGTSSFNSGQLLQYRIVGFDGTKYGYDIDFTVMSTISYTIT